MTGVISSFKRPPQQPSPWLRYTHFLLTAVLAMAGLSLLGLALAGKVHFGPPPQPAAAQSDAGGKASGRYQIEKVDDARDVLTRVGPTGFFGLPMSDAYVFKYSGGLLQCKLEVETAGEPTTTDVLPENWKECLQGEEAASNDASLSLQRTGYIVLAAVSPPRPLAEELAPYHVHFGGLFAFGPVGPLHVLTPLHLEVSQMRNYQLFLSAGPPTGVSGAGFNSSIGIWRRIRTPLVLKNPAVEDAFIGDGKDFTPAKERVILDRQRGSSRIRLKARFLGDGEVRELLPK